MISVRQDDADYYHIWMVDFCFPDVSTRRPVFCITQFICHFAVIFSPPITSQEQRSDCRVARVSPSGGNRLLSRRVQALILYRRLVLPICWPFTTVKKKAAVHIDVW
jgi:hypothetical protein